MWKKLRFLNSHSSHKRLLQYILRDTESSYCDSQCTVGQENYYNNCYRIIILFLLRWCRDHMLFRTYLDDYSSPMTDFIEKRENRFWFPRNSANISLFFLFFRKQYTLLVTNRSKQPFITNSQQQQRKPVTTAVWWQRARILFHKNRRGIPRCEDVASKPSLQRESCGTSRWAGHFCTSGFNIIGRV